MKKEAGAHEPEVLQRCAVCGEPKMIRIYFPIHGDDAAREVYCSCRCVDEKRQAIERRLRMESERREMSELRRMSLLDDNKECSNARFDTYKVDAENSRQFNIAQRYVENFKEMYRQRQGLLFYGDVGTGKSYTAAVIANELIDRYVPVVMTSFVKLIDEIRRQALHDDDRKSSYLDRLNRAKLLVVDDLGAERDTDYALEKVYDVVDSRYRDGKPVIFTTNLTMQQMIQCEDIRYTRIYDRIFEMCYPVKFSGLSSRKQNAARRYENMKKILEG